MIAAEPEGRSFEAVECEGEAIAPHKAESWLRDWGVIGGGMNIGRKGELNPFRFIPIGLSPRTSADADYVEGALLHDLRHTPGLAMAIRAVMGAKADRMMRSALKGMGIDQ